MQDSYCPPLRLIIPLPSQLDRMRGPESSGSYGGNLRVRCTDAEYDLLKAEAEELGLTLGMFCRCLLVNAARVLKSHREQNKDTLTSSLGEVKDGT